MHFVAVFAVTLAWHQILYFGSQYLEGEPRTVGWPIDRKIPFVPGFVYVYCSWFFLLALVPGLLFLHDTALCARYFAANVLDLTVSTAAFVPGPTAFQRPALRVAVLTGGGPRTVYRCNHRFLNCAPSVHCSLSFLFLFSMLACPAVPAGARLGIGLLSLLIVCATMLVKQHVLLDAITALPTALACWFAAELFPLDWLTAFLAA